MVQHPTSHPTVDEAAAIIRRGGAVAFPTETVYGLGADALNEAAVGRVFALKGRPAHNPLIVHVADEAMARHVASAWSDRASRLARAFWPGPLTIVVPRAQRIPTAVTAFGATVAVRCPDHPLALALIRAVGGPIVGPSANPSGTVSPTTAEHARAAFVDRVPVLDGGPCAIGIESTVVTVAERPPRVLRMGAVSAEALSVALGEDVSSGASPAAPGALPSPGLLASHYAPAASAELVDAQELATRAAEPGAMILALEAPLPNSPSIIRMPPDAGAYATRLYAALREADSRTPGIILIERPTGESWLWSAIRDRLARACAPRG